jgi:hypothetical protein
VSRKLFAEAREGVLRRLAIPLEVRCQPENTQEGEVA